MVEVEAKKVVLKNLAGEHLVPITEPYTAGEGIKIENNVISAQSMPGVVFTVDAEKKMLIISYKEE